MWSGYQCFAEERNLTEVWQDIRVKTWSILTRPVFMFENVWVFLLGRCSECTNSALSEGLNSFLWRPRYALKMDCGIAVNVLKKLIMLHSSASCNKETKKCIFACCEQRALRWIVGLMASLWFNERSLVDSSCCCKTCCTEITGALHVRPESEKCIQWFINDERRT